MSRAPPNGSSRVLPRSRSRRSCGSARRPVLPGSRPVCRHRPGTPRAAAGHRPERGTRAGVVGQWQGLRLGPWNALVWIRFRLGSGRMGHCSASAARNGAAPPNRLRHDRPQNLRCQRKTFNRASPRDLNSPLDHDIIIPVSLIFITGPTCQQGARLAHGKERLARLVAIRLSYPAWWQGGGGLEYA
jgi:hypothetical protein